jgi:hypothetical protein
MREELKKMNGSRVAVTAEVGNFGTKKAYKGYPIETVCLIDLKDALGNNLCDHLWMTVGKQFKSLNLAVGDKLKFTARAKKYTKGYKGRREGVYAPIETDYKLSNPTQFSKL